MAGPKQDTPSCILVSLRACSSAPPNATTAASKTSTGLPIAVTFCHATRPGFSNFSVHCPGIVRSSSFMLPTFISQDADLVLLRVPLDPRSKVDHSFYSDYFVYSVNPQRPELDLLPNPYPESFGDNEIAILSCADDSYVVAALQFVPGIKPTFKLHLYRSTDGKQGTWTSQLLSVEQPLRHKVCPIPESAERQIYHRTTKVIVLGDDIGTVGWVDLWRGIILCGVLSERPMLHDLPLPLPAKGNLSSFLNCCPSYFRDITVNQRKDTIKYIEIEITAPKKVHVPSGSDPDWVAYQGKPNSIVPGSWTATTWAVPTLAASWYAWHVKCSASLDNLSLPPVKDNPKLHKILNRLLSIGDCEEQEATGATLPLGCLCMAYPTLTVLDDDDVYFLSKSISMRNIVSLVTVDVKNEVLQGMRVLVNNRSFIRDFSSGISVSGASASLGQAKKTEANKYGRRGKEQVQERLDRLKSICTRASGQSEEHM
ncbi:hypothetical protein EJB05_56492, partial [Eragrostis curvula]